ncbi:MAG: glutathione S-transferase N-terminal domain-containing protein [Candidatus Thalassarchaeaceae archaeon]|nr:glutathione S-transferase N-terminal domain-containing protein [Candidatus Thalassarchaeaceae archaeon]
MADDLDANKISSGVQEKLVPERVVDGLPTIYCFETCPFCFKVKALLGSRGIKYSKVEVDPTFKTQLKWSDWEKVPIFVDIDGTQVNDSNYILHYIDSNDSDSFPKLGEDPEQDRWMDFSNQILGKSIVAVIYTSYRTSVQALDYVTRVDKFSFGSRLINKWLGGFIMRMVGKSRAKMFDRQPRENLQYQLDVMSEAIRGEFFGKDEPNGADYANFGILRSMQGLNGFDIVENHNIVSGWYRRMQKHSGV